MTALSNYPVVFYGGAKGGGKSWFVRAWQIARRVKYPNTRGVIIRKTYPELLANHIQEMWKEFPDLHQYFNKSEKSIMFPNGSILDFRYLKSTDDVYNYQGVQYEDIALDECTQHSEEAFTILRSSNRTTNPNISCRFLLTGNPGGIGHGWVKRLFIDRQFKENEREEDYAFVQAFVYDNDILMENDPDYIRRLEGLPEEKRKAYLEGDWDVFEGQFFSEFRKEKHVIKPRYLLSEAPETFSYYLTWDEGTLKPRSVVLLARDNDGKVEAIWEYYRTQETASEAARNIRVELTRQGIWSLIKRQAKMVYDPAMNIRGNEGKSTIEIVQNILQLDNPPIAGNNDRITGAARFKEFMAWSELSAPLFQIWDTCTNGIRTLPTLIYIENGKEDIDTDGEDHWYDCVRYGLMEMKELPTRLSGQSLIAAASNFTSQQLFDKFGLPNV